MESMGADVSQKIRSAIKAKLIELGAYVDDELPDYIMVMVANKKTKSQMADDLSLFLGNNTNKFTSWLHDVLERLQSVAAEKKKKLDGRVKETSVRGTTVEKVISAKISRPSLADKPEGRTSAEWEDEVLAPDPEETENTEEVLAIKADLDADDLLDEEFQEEMKALPEVAGQELPQKPRSIVPVLPTTKPPVVGKTDVLSPVKKRLDLRPEARVLATGIKRPAAAVIRPVTPKRRAPSSLVGAVVQRPPAEEDDDDGKMGVVRPGSLASIVRVSERRPSVPPRMQANRNLIMRAVEEAKKSVETAHIIPARIEPYRPEPYRPASVRETLHKKFSQATQPATVILHPRYPEVVSSDEEMNEDNDDSLDLDIRLVEESTEKAYKHGVGARLQSGKYFVTSVAVDDDDAMDESSSSSILHSTSASKLRVVQDSLSEDGSLSPNFIVTLDGIDPELFLKKAPQNPVLKGARSRENDSSSNVVKPVCINLDEFEVDDGGGGRKPGSKASIVPTKQRSSERCKYWPACKNGDSCTFHHPIAQCKAFPNCKYAEKCLYIHPNCKYDATCTKRNCPYTHASKRIVGSALITAAPVLKVSNPADVKCKYFPRCTNLNCPYFHPRPCRYGLACNQPQCVFTHPPMPTRDKLKWIAGAAPTSAVLIVGCAVAPK